MYIDMRRYTLMQICWVYMGFALYLESRVTKAGVHGV